MPRLTRKTAMSRRRPVSPSLVGALVGAVVGVGAVAVAVVGLGAGVAQPVVREGQCPSHAGCVAQFQNEHCATRLGPT